MTTIQQTAKLLRLVSGLWQNLKISDDTVIAWHFIFFDENPEEVLLFLRAALKEGIYSTDFPPPPQVICSDMRKARKPFESPALIFQSGPGAAKSQLAKEAWKIWGGAARWSAMPDLKRSQNSERALMSWRFEENRFAEIFDSILKQGEHATLRLVHKEAESTMRLLKKGGVDLTRLLTHEKT